MDNEQIQDMQDALQSGCDDTLAEFPKPYHERKNKEQLVLVNKITIMRAQIKILELLKRPA